MLGVRSGNVSLVSLRLWSCAGAFTTHLGCSHDAKEEEASDTTHFHRYLAAEILSRILNVRSVVSAKSEHADNPRGPLTWQTSLLKFIPTISRLLKLRDFVSLEPTSNYYAGSVEHRESHALSSNLPKLYQDIETWKNCLGCQWVWLYLHMRRIEQTKGVRCTRNEAGASSTPSVFEL